MKGKSDEGKERSREGGNVEEEGVAFALYPGLLVVTIAFAKQLIYIYSSFQHSPSGPSCSKAG